MIPFFKTLVVFYTVKIVHFCVFMTCSASYRLCNTLMYPHEIYVRNYQCTYVRMYVHATYKMLYGPQDSNKPPYPP